MRTLIFLKLFAPLAFGAAGNFSTVVSSQSTQGSLDVTGVAEESGLPNTSQTYSIQSPTLGRYWTLQLDARVLKNDYKNYMVTEKRAVEAVPLKSQFDELEYSANLSTSFQKGPHSVSLSHGRSLGGTPFEFVSYGLSYDISLLYSTTTVGFATSNQVTNQPDSYFVNPRDRVRYQRPTQLSAIRNSVHWQQIWTSRYKTDFIVFRGERREDRPFHWGAEFRQALAIQDGLFAKLHLGRLDEDGGKRLVNERGRFDVHWLEAQVDYQPTFDLTLSAFAGMVIELESERPNTKVIGQMGTDSAGVALDYAGSWWSLNSRLTFQRTNTGYNSQILSGGVNWDI